MVDISFSRTTINIGHMLIGLFILYIGYLQLNNKEINKNLIVVLQIIGAMALLYHGHIYYVYSIRNKE